MKKTLLTTALVAVFTLTGSVGLCANDTFKSIKQDFKDTGKAVKQGVKDDVKNAQIDSKNQRKAEIEKQKAADLKDIDTKIAAKKKEIEDVEKNSKSMTEKNLKKSGLERELKYLQDKRQTTEVSYNKRLDALK